MTIKKSDNKSETLRLLEESARHVEERKKDTIFLNEAGEKFGKSAKEIHTMSALCASFSVQ